MSLPFPGSASSSHSQTQKGGNQSQSNHLAPVQPLDWLFSDSEPEPPGSPKHVSSRNRETSSSQGSSGTDSETKYDVQNAANMSEYLTLLSKSFFRTLLSNPVVTNSGGAIPKRRLSSDQSGDTNSSVTTNNEERRNRHNRRAFRRRQNPTATSFDEGCGEGEEVEADEMKRRIIEILSAPSEEDHEQELDKLRVELEMQRTANRNDSVANEGDRNKSEDASVRQRQKERRQTGGNSTFNRNASMDPYL